jgi:hypothetical protein
MSHQDWLEGEAVMCGIRGKESKMKLWGKPNEEMQKEETEDGELSEK